MLALGAELTDANAALFDPAHRFAGCIAGIHEVLRRQGLLAGRWCLDPHEDLSPGQMEEIDRVLARYPHLTDDEFVKEHLHRWLRLTLVLLLTLASQHPAHRSRSKQPAPADLVLVDARILTVDGAFRTAAALGRA